MINDYDKYAKERQEKLIKGTALSHKYVEKPMMCSMMPDLKGKKVLMLGCGTGEETKLLESFGASELIGIDLSEASIEIAKETYPKYDFIIGDMHELPFSDSSFDFVYSSLAVHYSSQPEKVYSEVFRVLKKNGQFLFSIGHPIRWASENIFVNDIKTKLIGFSEDYNGILKIYGNYSTFSPHEHHFDNGEVLKFYVGSPSMHFKLLKQCGFSIDDFTESKCIEEAKSVNESYYKRFSELPQFIAFLATKLN